MDKKDWLTVAGHLDGRPHLHDARIMALRLIPLREVGHHMDLDALNRNQSPLYVHSRAESQVLCRTDGTIRVPCNPASTEYRRA